MKEYFRGLWLARNQEPNKASNTPRAICLSPEEVARRWRANGQDAPALLLPNGATPVRPSADQEILPIVPGTMLDALGFDESSDFDPNCNRTDWTNQARRSSPNASAHSWPC